MPCWESWERKFEIIPPGVWCARIPGSMTGSILLLWRRLGASSRKYWAIFSNAVKSRLGAYCVSEKIVASDSTGGWDENPAMDDMAQSIAPAPARTAATYVAVAMPLEA